MHIGVVLWMAAVNTTNATFSGHSNQGFQVGYNSSAINIAYPGNLSSAYCINEKAERIALFL